MRDPGTSGESDLIPVVRMLNKTPVQNHERKRGAEEQPYLSSSEKLRSGSRRKLFF